MAPVLKDTLERTPLEKKDKFLVASTTDPCDALLPKNASLMRTIIGDRN